MTDKSATPPDFNNWELSERVSLFFDPHAPNGQRVYTAELKSDDKEQNYWLGTGLIYKSKDGLAAGKEFNIFDKGPRLKLWRLIGDPKQNFHFAILNNHRWEIYSSLTYVLHISSLAQKSNPTRIAACKIWIDLAVGKQIMMEIGVERD